MNSDTPRRNVLVAIDLSDSSLRALQWTAHEFCRNGDVLHLVHVARILSPQYTIHHQYPGSSYTVPDPNPIDEKQYAKDVGEIIKSRFTSELDAMKIAHSLHMFLDTNNAPASAICASIFKVAEQIEAVLIVMACHNKAYGWDTMFLGSVADYATQNSKYPVMIIRDYKVKGGSVAASPSKGPAPASTTPQQAMPAAGPAAPFVITAASGSPLKAVRSTGGPGPAPPGAPA